MLSRIALATLALCAVAQTATAADLDPPHRRGHKPVERSYDVYADGPADYVINMGQPGYNGRGDLPPPYTIVRPPRSHRPPAYVVNMGQPGYNGRGDLPRQYVGTPDE